MVVEGAVAIAAAVIAGSVALLGFGIDSAVEGMASVIVIWRFTGSRRLSAAAERRAQKLVTVSFFLLAPYIAQAAVRALIDHRHPSSSWLGIGLSISSLLVMPLLGRAKQRVGARLGSAATAGEGAQNLLCAYMAAAVLVGLLANTVLGAWWVDPVIALGIAVLAIQEGRDAWAGEACGCGTSPLPLDGEPAACADGRWAAGASGGLDSAPVACHLDLQRLGEQRERYRRLGASVERTARRPLELTVQFTHDVDERLLEETLGIERECCPFFSLRYDPRARQLTARVSDADQDPTLDALSFALSSPADRK